MQAGVETQGPRYAPPPMGTPTLESTWPFFGLCLRTPRLVLRLPTDAHLNELATLAASGIHDHHLMPFAVPWTDAPPGVLERSTLQYHWGRRAALKPTEWDLSFGVWIGGCLAGMQTIAAKNFAAGRTVETGSWLGRAFQRQGIGLEMRAAVLHLAFEGLGAKAAASTAFVDNLASRRISERLGYRLESEGVLSPRGTPQPNVRSLLTRERWLAGARLPVSVEGLSPCLPLLLDLD